MNYYEVKCTHWFILRQEYSRGGKELVYAEAHVWSPGGASALA